MCENPSQSHATPAKVLASCCTCFCAFLSPIHILEAPPNTISGTAGQSESYVAAAVNNNAAHERIDKSHWVCDYADDIFQTLRETELKRYTVCYRSQQCTFRPALLRLLKIAAEKLNLARTTLHLSVYYLDCFMDNFTIRPDKLNLTALTCLMVASKIEEADANMPKFAKLNALIGSNYTLSEYKNVETKILTTFHFDLLRPTTATFAEYFANSCLTLDDYHMYLRNWAFVTTSSKTATTTTTVAMSPLYASYEEAVKALSTKFFAMVDISLSYFKFANERPSVLAAACIAAVRQVQNVLPIWTPYLITLTECSADMIASYVEALLTLYNLHISVSKGEECVAPSSLPTTSNAVLCDSPDSGIVSCDTKSESSADEDSQDEDCEEEPEPSLEYPLLAKRRRLF